MKGFDKKYKDFPDYILKITKQIWEGKDVDSIGEFYINSKDTFSLPLNTIISISIDNDEECFLNCVSKA